MPTRSRSAADCEGECRAEVVRAPSRAAFLHAMPKIDLHAHINGSLPAATVLELLREADPELYKVASGDGEGSIVLRSSALLAMRDPAARMARCFKVFDAVYRVMGTAERMRIAMFAMLDAYRAENTFYLELRTTPRAGVSFPPAAGNGGDAERRVGTEQDYVAYTLQLLDEYDAKSRAAGKAPMRVRLLLSVGRRMTASAADKVVDLATASQATHTVSGMPRVVGIDFSGDCYSGQWSTYAPAIARAKAAGLRVSLHVGEKQDDEELAAMLASGPDRIGHLVFAGDANVARVKAMKVPLELCITSNLMTTDWTVRDHHVGDWFKLRGMGDGDKVGENTSDPGLAFATQRIPGLEHPVSINTDDRGVFDCTLTHELVLFLQCLFGGESEKVEESAFLDQPIRPEEALAAVAVTKQGIIDSFVPATERDVLLSILGTFCLANSALLNLATRHVDA